jgi:hypothetical protein
MKTLLLAAVALLAVSAPAYADASLPREMLGKWCELPIRAGRGEIFIRKPCGSDSNNLKMKRNGYEGQISDGEGYGCEFKKIKRLPNGSYFVHAECGGEGGITNEDMVLSIEDKNLVIKTITIRFCVSVIEPPPNVAQDPEYNPDHWLGLREGPGKQFKIITTLGGNEYLEADRTKEDWTHISNVTRLSATDNAGHQKIIQGWVPSKYVKRFTCETEYEPKKSEEPEPKCDIPGCDDTPRPAIPGLSSDIPTILTPPKLRTIPETAMPR